MTKDRILERIWWYPKGLLFLCSLFETSKCYQLSLKTINSKIFSFCFAFLPWDHIWWYSKFGLCSGITLSGTGQIIWGSWGQIQVCSIQTMHLISCTLFSLLSQIFKLWNICQMFRNTKMPSWGGSFHSLMKYIIFNQPVCHICSEIRYYNEFLLLMYSYVTSNSTLI